MRKNFLKVGVLLLEFVRKIAICCSSYILRIDFKVQIPTSYKKNESWISYDPAHVSYNRPVSS